MRNLGTLAKITLVAAFGLLGFQACSSSVTEPESSDVNRADAQIGQTIQNEIPDILAEHADIYEEPAARGGRGGFWAASNLDFQFVRGAWLVKIQSVQQGEATTVSFGTDEAGYSEIHFPANAFDDDQIVTIVMKIHGQREFYFYPEGAFNEPVGVVLSYKGTNVKDVDETSLRLFLYDVIKQVVSVGSQSRLADGKDVKEKMRVIEVKGWVEVNGSWVNPDADQVYAELDHFSRYAIGGDQ